MRAYVQQARQDKSFKGVSYSLDAAAITSGGTSKNISFSGGAVGASPVNAPLNSAPTSATLVGSQATTGTFTGGNLTIQAAGLTGGHAVTITIGNNTAPPAIVTA